jgi:hypothetical protein
VHDEQFHALTGQAPKFRGDPFRQGVAGIVPQPYFEQVSEDVEARCADGLVAEEADQCVTDIGTAGFKVQV